ncbi:MAG TPA: nucleotide exchange factor GrpE [Candidatus Paceibacterota bacterium]|nr:nucleotide exchange factor GrpE [Candidatus Paceibacterota bacterium]
MKDHEIDDVVFEDADEESDSNALTQKIKKLQHKIAELEKEKTEYLDGWQRSRADYANLQKNQDEDKKHLRSIIEEDFIHELLPVVDSFEQAFNNKVAWEAVDANWRTGVEYIYQQLMTALENHSLHAFGKIGELFDPSRHHAVSETPTTEKKLDHTVATVLQRGFLIGNDVVRPARVSVYTYSS